MKVLTYLGFTLLSILMQFCVMDFIEEQIKKNKQLDLNTSQRETNSVLKNLSHKAHALYYQNNIVQPAKLLETYTNSTITESLMEPTTELSTSVIDVFYDENATTTDYTSTEPVTTTDIGNVTEFTLFEKTNSTVKPKILPKNNETFYSNNCYCDLMFKMCDINCCCDADCTDADRLLFECKKVVPNLDNSNICLLSQPFKLEHSNTVDFIENLFCVAKTNLPEKRTVHLDKVDTGILNKVYKWTPNIISEQELTFSKKAYSHDDAVWLYQNGSILNFDLPTKTVTNYCSSRVPLMFLDNKKSRCNVKLGDLEMLHAYNIAKETKVVSVSNKTINNTVLNCSTLTCTNWTVIVCNDDTCENFNKSKHEPLCSQTYCTNMALRIDYIFHYSDAKFINATMKFYTKTISLAMPFIPQEVNVKFILGNSSVDNIIEFSGNPGYIKGLPVIVSYDKGNHSESFFNSTNKLHFLPYVTNKQGSCFSSNLSTDFVLFGVNKRRNCKLEYKDQKLFKKNATDICKGLQNSIDSMFRLNEQPAVAPIGNPFGLKDTNWIPLTKHAKDDPPIYGQFYRSNTTLRCFNLRSQLSYIFVFRDYSEVDDKKKNTIYAAFVQETSKNSTFDVDDLSTTVTMDTVFIDGTDPPVTEFAGSPHLNIHLPKDFFFPFPSNCSYFFKTNIYVLLSFVMLVCVVK